MFCLNPQSAHHGLRGREPRSSAPQTHQKGQAAGRLCLTLGGNIRAAQPGQQEQSWAQAWAPVIGASLAATPHSQRMIRAVQASIGAQAPRKIRGRSQAQRAAVKRAAAARRKAPQATDEVLGDGLQQHTLPTQATSSGDGARAPGIAVPAPATAAPPQGPAQP